MHLLLCLSILEKELLRIEGERGRAQEEVDDAFMVEPYIVIPAHQEAHGDMPT